SQRLLKEPGPDGEACASIPMMSDAGYMGNFSGASSRAGHGTRATLRCPHTTRPDGCPPLFLLLFTGNYQRATARSSQKSLGLASLRQKKRRKSAARGGRLKIDLQLL